jgi:replication factor C subunit 3/5
MASPHASTLPWIEKYRPSAFCDISDQNHVIKTVLKLVAEKQMPHLLFYGPPGTGKTSTILTIARAYFGDQAGQMTLELNASDDRGIEVVRNEIQSFASSQRIFSSGYKLVILDECDSMTKDAQFALRRVIEKYTKHTRFCLIGN